MKVQKIVALLILGMAVFISTAFSGGEKQEPKVYKGRLPNGWGKLNISATQKQKIYKVQTEYRKKRMDLMKQLRDLKIQERTEMVKVLTQEQRDLLKKLVLGGVVPKDEPDNPKTLPKPKNE